MESQLRRRAGIQRKMNTASTAPPPAPIQPFPLTFGYASFEVVPAVVCTVAISEAGLGVPLVYVTWLGESVQVGGFVTLDGETVQVKVTVPLNPALLPSAMVSVDEPPALIDDDEGVPGVIVRVAAVPLTITSMEAVWMYLPEVPVTSTW